jgi:hypothetical protein
MSEKEREVFNAAVALLTMLSDGQLARARSEDNAGRLTQVPAWTIAKLEVAVEGARPGWVARVRERTEEAMRAWRERQGR